MKPAKYVVYYLIAFALTLSSAGIYFLSPTWRWFPWGLLVPVGIVLLLMGRVYEFR